MLTAKPTMTRIWLPLLMAASSAVGQAPSITKKLTIGCESCGGPDQFGSIWDVSISARGEILVTDRDAPMLRRFELDGRSVWTGGAKGRGPGEFIMPIRSALTPTGVTVVDMTNSRITDLDASGKVIRSTPLTGFATTTGVNQRGDLVMGFDQMGRSFNIVVRTGGAAELREIAKFPGSYENKSVAVAPDASVSVNLDGKSYEIRRLDAAGTATAPITRDLQRPRRSSVEESEFRQLRGRDLAMVAAEAKKAGGDGKVKEIPIPPEERGLKPHIHVDGLQYDDAGRLWVLTMQGDETKTIFDVFSPAGSFLGPVTVPMRVSKFALRGAYLAAAGENADGIPVVTVWTVK